MTFQTFTGAEYLKIDIANNFGLDKENWDDRISWFNDNENNLENMIKQAEEPALFFAGLEAWKDYKNQKPSGYPISLDAVASGLQHLAIMTGDRKAAELCNIVDTGSRKDAYTDIYKAMLINTGGSAKIERKDTKSAIMTSLYGSTSIPKEIFGEGELLNIFYQTMRENAPGAWELNETFLAIWDNTRFEYSWILPDNFHVHIKVMGTVSERINFLEEPFEVSYSVNMPIDGGRSLGANTTHSQDGLVVREMVRRCMYDPIHISRLKEACNNGVIGQYHNDPNNGLVEVLWEHYKKSGFLSARILKYLQPHNIHLVDSKVILKLIESLPKKPFEILSIHDCFRCLPNYGNDMRKQYNQIMSDLARSNMLSFIMSQIIGRHIPVKKLDNNLWKDILSANYALS